MHTFNGYRRFWPGFAAHFAARWHHAALCWPVAFATDEGDASAALDSLHACGIADAAVAPTGPGAFSTRLHAALSSVSSPLVLYMQEDVWMLPIAADAHEPANESAGRLPALLACASALVLSGRFDGIRFEPRSALHAGWYHLQDTSEACAGSPVHRLAHSRNRWLYSHQPGLWRVRALLDGGGGAPAVMQPEENPWANELLGTRRAVARGLEVGLIVVDWFAAVSSGGELNVMGEAMTAAAEEMR